MKTLDQSLTMQKILLATIFAGLNLMSGQGMIMSILIAIVYLAVTVSVITLLEGRENIWTWVLLAVSMLLGSILLTIMSYQGQV